MNFGEKINSINSKTKHSMIDIVRHERSVELAFELLRFFDLKRWGIMEDACQRAIADPFAPYNAQYRIRRY